MVCSTCQRRSALLAELAGYIQQRHFARSELLDVLALTDTELIEALAVSDSKEMLHRVAQAAKANDLGTAICRHDPAYPESLSALASAPAVLHVAGDLHRLLELLDKPTVALLGSRRHTFYGRDRAFKMGSELTAAGVTVISGLGPGIESYAHAGSLQAGALEASGGTIAVMPGGADIPYPSDQDIIHNQVVAVGAAISEFPPGFAPAGSWCFLARSRLIAALAKVTVVIEATEYAGCLFTAHLARDLGRDVAVVPGRATDAPTHGSNALLRDGAHPVLDAQNVLDLLHEVNSRQEIAALSEPSTTSLLESSYEQAEAEDSHVGAAV
jgi:DNA processing protein